MLASQQFDLRSMGSASTRSGRTNSLPSTPSSGRGSPGGVVLEEVEPQDAQRVSAARQRRAAFDRRRMARARLREALVPFQDPELQRVLVKAGGDPGRTLLAAQGTSSGDPAEVAAWQKEFRAMAKKPSALRDGIECLQTAIKLAREAGCEQQELEEASRQLQLALDVKDLAKGPSSPVSPLRRAASMRASSMPRGELSPSVWDKVDKSWFSAPCPTPTSESQESCANCVGTGVNEGLRRCVSPDELEEARTDEVRQQEEQSDPSNAERSETPSTSTTSAGSGPATPSTAMVDSPT